MFDCPDGGGRYSVQFNNRNYEVAELTVQIFNTTASGVQLLDRTKEALGTIYFSPAYALWFSAV